MKPKHASSLTSLFDPKSVAVIGASRDGKSVGTSILENIIASGFKGNIIPVNPHADEILGLPVVRDVSDLTHPIDLAIIAVPAGIIPSILEKGKGILTNVIIISSGFSEIGPEGKALELTTLEKARASHIRIIGPNTLGMIVPGKNLNASFAKTTGVPGSIALVTQSGALGSSFLDIAKSRGIGLSAFVSIGNMIDITETELLSFFTTDPHTKTIALYMESLSEAPEFIDAVRQAEHMGKRVIVLKAGTTAKGQKAAATHTGAFSADKNLYEGIFKQAGLIEARDCEHFVNMLSLVDTIPYDHPPFIILTNAGGPGILACDAAETFHLPLAETSDFPNPYDIRGDASSVQYEEALLKIEHQYPGHPILVITTPQTVTDSENIAQKIIEAHQRNICPVVVSFIGDSSFVRAKERIIAATIPSLSYPEDVIDAAASLSKRYEIPKLQEVQKQKNNENMKTAEALELMREEGLPIARFGIAVKPDEIQNIIDTIRAASYALKIISPDISHKSDVGGVVLRVLPADVPSTFQRMWAVVHAKVPNAKITGICIMEMAHVNDPIELFFGMKKDAHLGNAFFLGVGGIYTNIIADIQIRFLPFSDDDVLDMISSLRLYPILKGARGKKPYAIQKIIDMARIFQKMIRKHPEIIEFDINPILLSDTEAIIIDGRMLVSES